MSILIFLNPKEHPQLVCHLFAGPESCTLKPNRPLSDSLRGKELRSQPLTHTNQYFPPKKTQRVPLLLTAFCQQTHGLRWEFKLCVYICVLCKHQGSGAEEKIYIYSSPFFLRKAFLVAKGLSRTFGFCRNFTAVVI